jgi:hypothetical protein
MLYKKELKRVYFILQVGRERMGGSRKSLLKGRISRTSGERACFILQVR